MLKLLDTLIIDKKNKRWLQILSKLEINSEVSSNTLADIVSAAPRTIATDIKEIKDYFSASIIVSTTTNGYSISVIDKTIYIQEKLDLLEKEPLLELIVGIFYGEKLTFKEWADKLYITDKTFNTYLKNLTPLLKHFNIKLDSPLLSLKGDEVDIRNFFLAIFYHDSSIPYFIVPPVEINIILENFCYDVFEKYQLDIPLYKFSTLLFVAYQRVQTGNPIHLNDMVVNMFKENDILNSFRQIDDLFTLHLNVSLSQEELIFFSIKSMSYVAINDKSQTKLPLYIENLPHDLVEAIHQFCNQRTIPANSYLFNYVVFFFSLYYLKSCISYTCLLNPFSLNEHFTENYTGKLEQTALFLREYPNAFWTNSINDFKVTLFLFDISIEYIHAKKDFTVVFIFEGPPHLRTILEEICRENIPSRHTVYFFSSRDFKSTFSSDFSFDLLVTNFADYIYETDSLLKNKKDFDYILFNPTPTSEDWNTLINYLYPQLTKTLKIFL